MESDISKENVDENTNGQLQEKLYKHLLILNLVMPLFLAGLPKKFV